MPPNVPGEPVSAGASEPKKKRASPTKPLPDEDILQGLFEYLSLHKWTLGQALHHIFSMPKKKDARPRRPNHISAVQHFLRNPNSRYPAIDILRLIMHHPMSHPEYIQDLEADGGYYNLSGKPLSEMRYAAVAITSYAARIVSDEMGNEFALLEDDDNGLRVRCSEVKSKSKADGGGSSDTMSAPVRNTTTSAENTGFADPEVQAAVDGSGLRGTFDEIGGTSDEGDAEGEDEDHDSAGPAVRHDPDATPRTLPRRGGSRDPKASWEAINSFSLKSLDKTYSRVAPLTHALLGT
ncbi:unnamed protein product [Peniophora sp. CBMAI 1063]|nr:unnamed protein product [Peniophora sp. CBMAI 1063]